MQEIYDALEASDALALEIDQESFEEQLETDSSLAKKVSKATGVKTIAAFDGLSFNVNYNNPKRFRLISLKDVQSSVHSTSHNLYDSEKRNSYQLAFKHQEFDELAMVKNSKNQYSKFDG